MRIKSAVFGIISFMIPTILYTTYVIYYFYSGKATLLDAGWFSYLLTHSLSFPIPNPTVLYSTHLGNTFLQTHISPFFYFFSLLHRYILFFIPPPVYFSLFTGFSYGVLSLSVYIAGLNLLPGRSVPHLFYLSIISVLTAFNGAALGLTGFPHIEIAIPAFILLFVSLYFGGYRKLSVSSLIFLLGIREDAGLHLFALLSMIIFAHLLYVKSLKKLDYTLIVTALLALTYSIAVIFIQKIYFPGDNALIRIYLGTPPFAHLTAGFLEHRFDYIIQNREYLYIPAIATLILTAVSRNFFLSASFFAVIPWVALSVTAVTDMPGTLSNYYAFPLIIMLSWPIPAFLIYKVYIGDKKENRRYILAAVLFITLLSTALFPNNRGNADNKPWKDFLFTDLKKISDTNRFISILESNKKYLGNIIFDEALSAFTVSSLRIKEYGYLNNFSKEQIDNADTVVFYLSKENYSKSEYKKLSEIIRKKGMKHIFQVNGTDIIIATRLEKLSPVLDINLTPMSYDFPEVSTSALHIHREIRPVSPNR